jgi:hypothetical protein
MSENSKLSKVKVLLMVNQATTADDIVKRLKVTKVYAYNLLSTARKALGMQMQRDGTWKLKERMQSTPSRAVAKLAKQVVEVENLIATHNPAEDTVNHPPHYKTGGIETIDFIEAKSLGYNLGNVVKYIARADHKGNREQDLLKARWYLNREISKFAVQEK